MMMMMMMVVKTEVSGMWMAVALGQVAAWVLELLG